MGMAAMVTTNPFSLPSSSLGHHSQQTAMADEPRQETQRVSQILEALSKTLHDLQRNILYLQVDVNSPTIKAFLELEPRSNTILAQVPDLSQLSQLLARLKTLVNNLKSLQNYSFWSFVRRRIISFEITALAASIAGEIKARFDRESMQKLVHVLQESVSDDDKKLRVLVQFQRRISKGFDRGLQDLVLKLRVFPVLESILRDASCSTAVREKSAMAIAALARFNKDVFVGLVLMGGFTTRALASMGTSCSLQVLTCLIKLIRGHLVDQIQLNGDTPKIIGLSSSEDISVRATAMNCILEMAYFGRHEVIETMIECGLMEKLVCLQRPEELDCGGAESEEDKALGFAGCVARFALQVEMGEGMGTDEKKRIKMVMLRRAREASVSEAEAATIVADLLWGSFS
ncbi:hypothetical protein Dimus_010196 [Dionaea muscipula]